MLAGIAVAGAELALAACAPDRPRAAATPALAALAPSPTSSPLPTVRPSPQPTPTLTPGLPPRVTSMTNTTMSVLAHCDDDLIFAGAHLQRALAQGQAVRTLYLTAGDAGRGEAYALGREGGVMRAYDVLRGRRTSWRESTETLRSGATLVTRRPVDEPRISLHFLRLPDGNLNGQGFPATGHISLAALAADRIATIPDLTRREHLSLRQLIASIGELIARYRPRTFLTHVPGWSHALAHADHADHAITGILATAAWRATADPASTVLFARGYGIAELPANVTGAPLRRKLAAFEAYAADDAVVHACVNDASCVRLPHFGAWIQREYIAPLVAVERV